MYLPLYRRDGFTRGRVGLGMREVPNNVTQGQYERQDSDYPDFGLDSTHGYSPAP